MRPPLIVDAEDPVTAWKEAAAAVATQGGVDYMAVCTFRAPADDSHDFRSKLDAAAKQIGAEQPTSVASVLLPRSVLKSGKTPAEAIQEGQRLFGRLRRRGKRLSTWTHTYFERITGRWYNRHQRSEVLKPNRLLSAIQKMNEWGIDAKAAFYIHTDHNTDNFRTRGAPCLQYIQFRLHDKNRISLVALYRAHDYTNKALGNFLGLDSVLSFVAKSTDRTPSHVTVISLNPFCESSAKLNEYRNLL